MKSWAGNVFYLAKNENENEQIYLYIYILNIKKMKGWRINLSLLSIKLHYFPCFAFN